MAGGVGGGGRTLSGVMDRATRDMRSEKIVLRVFETR